MRKNLAIFDLDNTILNGDSDYSWINFLIQTGHVDKEKYEKKNQYFYDKYYEGNLDYDEWAEFALSTIKGKSWMFILVRSKRLNKNGKVCEIGRILFHGALNRSKKMRKAGADNFPKSSA